MYVAALSMVLYYDSICFQGLRDSGDDNAHFL